jgi:hypothetical protein
VGRRRRRRIRAGADSSTLMSQGRTRRLQGGIRRLGLDYEAELSRYRPRRVTRARVSFRPWMRKHLVFLEGPLPGQAVAVEDVWIRGRGRGPIGRYSLWFCACRHGNGACASSPLFPCVTSRGVLGRSSCAYCWMGSEFDFRDCSENSRRRQEMIEVGLSGFGGIASQKRRQKMI